MSQEISWEWLSKCKSLKVPIVLAERSYWPVFLTYLTIQGRICLVECLKARPLSTRSIFLICPPCPSTPGLPVDHHALKFAALLWRIGWFDLSSGWYFACAFPFPSWEIESAVLYKSLFPSPVFMHLNFILRSRYLLSPYRDYIKITKLLYWFYKKLFYDSGMYIHL